MNTQTYQEDKEIMKTRPSINKKKRTYQNNFAVSVDFKVKIKARKKRKKTHQIPGSC